VYQHGNNPAFKYVLKMATGPNRWPFGAVGGDEELYKRFF
jgi:hypothetical protein